MDEEPGPPGRGDGRAPTEDPRVAPGAEPGESPADDPRALDGVGRRAPDDPEAPGYRTPEEPDPRRPPEEADPRALERRLSRRLGDGSLPWSDAVKNEVVRRWDVVTPSATLIGRPDEPDGDVSETVRRLHDEHHPAMEGHAERMHRLDKARITHALCNALGLTPWERDRVLGIMVELDLTEFGSQRAVPTVALVAIRYVVDEERKRLLGLDDPEATAELTPDEMESLYERFESVTDEGRYRELLDEQDLDVTAVNRLTRTLREQVEGTDLEGAALGRAPHQDPALPAIRD